MAFETSDDIIVSDSCFSLQFYKVYINVGNQFRTFSTWWTRTRSSNVSPSTVLSRPVYKAF